MTWRTVVVSALLALVAGTAAAQDAEGSWEELVRSRRLRWGDKVTVNGIHGFVDGVVREVTPDSLVIASGDDTWRWDAADVRAIRKRDRVSSGAWLGFGAGLLTMAALARAQYGDEQAGYFMLYTGYPVAGVSALVGAIVDSRIQETVYRPQGTASVSLSPVATKGGVGARVSIGW